MRFSSLSNKHVGNKMSPIQYHSLQSHEDAGKTCSALGHQAICFQGLDHNCCCRVEVRDRLDLSAVHQAAWGRAALAVLGRMQLENEQEPPCMGVVLALEDCAGLHLQNGQVQAGSPGRTADIQRGASAAGVLCRLRWGRLSQFESSCRLHVATSCTTSSKESHSR